MELVDKIVDFFIWLCAQPPILEDEDEHEQEQEQEQLPKEPRVLTEEEKTLLWKNHFTLSEKVEELSKKVAEETNPVIKDGHRKSISLLKRRLTYNAQKLKLI
jgi:hypothetical protein